MINERHLIEIKMIHTFAIVVNFLHSDEEKPTYSCHFLFHILLFTRLDNLKINLNNQ
jgi:hypothetical protein